MSFNYLLDFSPVLNNTGLLAWGAGQTILISLAVCLIGLAVGCLCNLGRSLGPHWMHPFIEIYIDLTRNTPPLVQLFFIFFGLASLGLRLDAMPTAILVLSLYSGAYQAEIIRAGIAAVPKSQHEAAASLGLTRLQAWSRVLLAQSLETMFPALKSQFVLALLSTSLVSVLAARELLFVANELAAETYRNFEIYIAATVIYLLVVLTFRCGITLIGIAAFSRQRRRALGAMRRLIPGYILSRAA